MVYQSASPQETEAIGETLARTLSAGDVVAYQGDLGAGKTAFTRGIARGLGIEEAVTSPTFTIVNEYDQGRLPLFHFDLYRLGGEDGLFDLGFEEYFYRQGVCVIEWSEYAQVFLEEFSVIQVTITQGDGEENRRIEIISPSLGAD